jgi:hypothetical protein
MTFTEHDHARLATLFDGVRTDRDGPAFARPTNFPLTPYPGYKPEVREAPNGDAKECPACGGSCRFDPSTFDHHALSEDCPICNGTGRVPNVDAEGPHKWRVRPGKEPAHLRPYECALCGTTNIKDDGRPGTSGVCPGAPAKRYLHVAPKYDPPAWAMAYLARAHYEACRVAEALNVPAAYYPRVADGTLRVLEYPPGAGTVEHKDFDLFTIVLWRSTPEDLERRDAYEDGGMGVYPERLDTVSPGLHIGELGELVGLGPATPHRVPARPYAQKSILYFAMPDHGARLPNRYAPGWIAGDPCGGETVGEWLDKRKSASRVTT